MTALVDAAPRRREDLVIRQVSDDSFVVRTADARNYYSFGAEEHFLLQQLDGASTLNAIGAAYQREFGEPVESSDIEEFVDSLRDRGLIAGSEPARKVRTPNPSETEEEDEEDELSGSKRAGGSLLFYRIRLYDPNDRLTRWESCLRWIWTRTFLVISASVMLLALMVVWCNRSDLAASFPDALRWETALLVAVILVVSTALHEYAHGLTCKHFGGEVHEVGVLFVFFLPCLYCNVSDAWLIREKWKRLLITIAGGYFDLCQWAIAVFVWRLTVPGCLVNYIAFIVLSVCGSRGFVNFNPLLRLDGYYLLSDGLGIENLRQRARDYWTGHVRWCLWGAERPKRESRGAILLAYGILNWLFALAFLQIASWKMLTYVGKDFGWAGVVMPTILLGYALRRVFRGFAKGELRKMVTERRQRMLRWGGGMLFAVGILFLLPVRHYTNGDFEVRPGQVVHIHAPATGVVTRVFVEDGAQVEMGDPLIQLASPELDVQLAAKESELAEAEASLAKLRLGPRREQIREQQQQIARLEEWCRIGLTDLEHVKAAHAQQLIILEHSVKGAQDEADFAKKTVEQAEKLNKLGALAGLQLRSEQVQLSILESKSAQAKASLEALRVQGIREAQSDLIRRERELADARASLRLLEAGTRPEEIAAEEAKRDRVNHQLAFLKQQRERLLIRATAAGVIATPRMQERVGDLITPGLLLCAIENGATSHVEIAVPEEDARYVESGLPVKLKARSLPFQTFSATVDRISTVTNKELHSSKNKVIVHCRLDNERGLLRSGMTGLGRIQNGWDTAGIALVTGALKYLRTEFWW